jgi:hypothetical protein
MDEEDKKTSIQVTPATRDRLYKLKFRKTYDQFLNELSDLYESTQSTTTELSQGQATGFAFFS